MQIESLGSTACSIADMILKLISCHFRVPDLIEKTKIESKEGKSAIFNEYK